MALFAGHYMRKLQALSSVETIKAYRHKMEQLRDEELAKAKRSLQRGESPESVLDAFARGLTNKLMHDPSVQIRQASYDGRNEIVDYVRTLFDIDMMVE